MENQDIWTCSEMMRRTETLCQTVWEEISLWEPIARKVMGEPLMQAFDHFGIALEEIRGNCHLEQKKKVLKEANITLLKARRCLIRSARRGVISAKAGQSLLEGVEQLRYHLEQSILYTPSRRAA